MKTAENWVWNGVAIDETNLSIRVGDASLEGEAQERLVAICLDGFSWDFIHSHGGLPRELRRGSAAGCKAMVPTVTNVNNASILTGRYPVEHGISGNYYLDREKGLMGLMDTPELLRCTTMLEEASRRGGRTALLTVKDKLRRLLGRGATSSFSVEEPSPWILRELGAPPGVYSPDSSLWLLEATLKLLQTDNYSIIYTCLTDYVPHIFGYRSREAQQFLEEVGGCVHRILEEGVVVVTADHGMNEKRVKLDVEGALREKGVEVRMVPIIKDEYVKHHQDLGGSIYLYLEESGVHEALTLLHDLEGVHQALPRREASLQYQLPPDRIGDILVLGDRETVFGRVEGGVYEDVEMHSHGSLFEREVPFMINREIDLPPQLYNKDVFRYALP